MPKSRTQSLDLTAGRVEQKRRTREQIVGATRDLVLSGHTVTMRSAAEHAAVSLATLYRFFPDLPTLQLAVSASVWQDPAEILAPLRDVVDPVTRIGHAAEYLLSMMLRYESNVRATVAAEVANPGGVTSRPTLRLPLLVAALEPASAQLGEAGLERLVERLAVVVGPEALFVLTDVVGLSSSQATGRLVDFAQDLTRHAVASSA